MRYQVNQDRFFELFETFSKFGDSYGGISRTAFSAAHLEARRWLVARASEAGLSAHTDGSGNIFYSSFSESSSHKRYVLIGSHSDSVPQGGCYDGALGLLAGFEVLCALRDQNIKLPFSLVVADFADEEGTYIDFLGSRALIGDLPEGELREAMTGKVGVTKAFLEAGITFDSILSAKQELSNCMAYLELHIEQGPRLQDSGNIVGVVSGISGIRVYDFEFTGAANHAGTTPPSKRRDAGRGASAFVLQLSEALESSESYARVNVGRLSFMPGASNVIPAEARGLLELRAMSEGDLDSFEEIARSMGNRVASEFRLDFKLNRLSAVEPSLMDSHLLEVLADATKICGYPYFELESGAGHDAGILAKRVPAGLIFVPSRDGISHSPHEFTEWAHCVAGTNVLLNAVVRLAEDPRNDG